jgi:TPR repeat protein
MKRKVLWLGGSLIGILVGLGLWLFYSGEFHYRWGRWAESDGEQFGAIWLYHSATVRGHERAGIAFDRLCSTPSVLPKRSLPAREWCLSIATDHDETGAYVTVGRQALEGDGMPADARLGVALLEVAAGRGDALARELIAIAYLGMEPQKGIPKNVERGLYWLNEGAKRGDLRALDLLYRIYQADRLVPQDRIEYAKWLLLAVAYGDRELEGFVRDVCRYDLVPPEVAEAERRAKEWLERYPPREITPD